MVYSLVGVIIITTDKGYAYLRTDESEFHKSRDMWVYKTKYRPGDKVVISFESKPNPQLMFHEAKILCGIDRNEEWACYWVDIIRDSEIKL